MDAVGMNPSKSSALAFKVSKLGQFDIACHERDLQAVPESLLAACDRPRFAPEVEAGQRHDASADIWSLGQIAY